MSGLQIFVTFVGVSVLVILIFRLILSIQFKYYPLITAAIMMFQKLNGDTHSAAIWMYISIFFFVLNVLVFAGKKMGLTGNEVLWKDSKRNSSSGLLMYLFLLFIFFDVE